MIKDGAERGIGTGTEAQRWDSSHTGRGKRAQRGKGDPRKTNSNSFYS